MTKRRLVELSLIAVMVAGIGSAFVVWRPRETQSLIDLTSEEEIPKVAAQLGACRSLEAITRRFGCYTVTPEKGGISTIVNLSPRALGHNTYVSIFPDGRWIACVGAFGYGEGKPLVTRDSTGAIRAFTYVAGGRLRLKADTLEKAYEELSGRAHEVPIGR